MTQRLRALPVFWQTLLLLLSTLLIVQAVGFALLFLLPPPRPDFNRLSDIAAALGGNVPPEDRDLVPTVSRARALPPIPAELVAEPSLTSQLAQLLHRPDGEVRLFSQPDRGPGFPFDHRNQHRHAWRQEHIFFGQVIAAVAAPGGWLVVTTPPPPIVQPWQRRMMLWFAVGAVALLPLAWMFARAVSRQIRRFAEAADRLGADPRASPLEERGSVELQMAARAFNRMQGRLGEYLAERTSMIGAIAHDLRTPLARIAFRVEAAPEPVRDRVLADVSQMQAMISATIQFVRTMGERGRRVPVDLATLVRAIAEQDAELGRPVSLGALAPVEVCGDPIGLERLIQNLVNNGVTYGGGVELTLRREGGTAVFCCLDRGPGLARELMDRVFQPFVRAEPSRNRATGGIGLGLTIARTIAEDHGGTLTLGNRAGGGLEAVLRLPERQPGEAAGERVPAAAAQAGEADAVGTA